MWESTNSKMDAIYFNAMCSLVTQLCFDGAKIFRI